MGVRGVHQQARRLSIARRDEVDAGHASARQLHLELELEHVALTALQHVDAASLGSSEEEHAGVIEFQGADLRLHLELLQDHAVGNIDQPEDGIGVGRDKHLRVARQELGHRHRRAVREDFEHLAGVDAPEAHRLVDRRRDQLVLDHVEEDRGDRPRVPYHAGVHGDVGVVRRGRRRRLVHLRVVALGKHRDLHFGAVAPVDNDGAVLGGRGQEDVVPVVPLLAEDNASHR
mmetsp:Transcript_145180/g.404603  ORF Transcript_145180/g.404603 Transcript_145180/m.404603 type:complete len:231 (-) Transcript_145180:1003-1695(-)